MTVREYIETYKEKLIGYIIHIEDYDGYELFSFIMYEVTNVDNIRDSLVQQLLDDELVDSYGVTDDDEKQLFLTSRCEL